MFNLICYGSPALRETELACRELGVTIVAYAPIGQVGTANAQRSAATSRPPYLSAT